MGENVVGEGVVSGDDSQAPTRETRREADGDYLDDAEKELGDILWYVAQLASLLDADLDDIAEQNLDKLLDRQERGKITGEGDDR